MGKGWVEMATRSTASLRIGGTSVVALPDAALRLRSRPTYAACKRAVDVVGAFALLLFLVPVLLVVAIAIVIDTGWPVFYTGERVGRAARMFNVFKFRSMRADADASVHRDYLFDLLSGRAAPAKAGARTSSA